jgi:hypothetical protein
MRRAWLTVFLLIVVFRLPAVGHNTSIDASIGNVAHPSDADLSNAQGEVKNVAPGEAR